MNHIKLSPGDTLAVSLGASPEGEKVLLVPYDDLLKKLRVTHKSRRSKTPSSLLSRTVCLRIRALESGKWSTGAEINRGKVANALADSLERAPSEVLDGLSKNAREAIEFFKKSITIGKLQHSTLDDIPKRLITALCRAEMVSGGMEQSK